MRELIRSRPHYARVTSGLTCKNQSVSIRRTVNTCLFSSSARRIIWNGTACIRMIADSDWWLTMKQRRIIHANERAHSLLHRYSSSVPDSGSIRHFRCGSRGCNIMERYCARECKLGMHGLSEYSLRVNTRTLPGAWEGDRYEEWYEAVSGKKGWRGRYREQICRAEHNWSQKCYECSMVMEDNELDLQPWQKIPSTFPLGRRK